MKYKKYKSILIVLLLCLVSLLYKKKKKNETFIGAAAAVTLGVKYKKCKKKYKKLQRKFKNTSNLKSIDNRRTLKKVISNLQRMV